MAKDYYKTLGVSRNASASEIQKAYRDLARKYHPDLNPDDKTAKAKFQEVQAAFDVLNDPEKRKKYDQFGAGFESFRGGPGGGWSPGGAHYENIDLNDILGGAFHGGGPAAGGFADFFRGFTRGGGGAGTTGRTAARPGADLRHSLTVPFSTAVVGGEAQVSVARRGGRTETITVKVPAGIEDGKTIRLRGQGEPGIGGGPAGDILIDIRVAPHPHFHRRGKNLDLDVPVTLAEAVLGAKVDIPTPRGTIALSVPPCTSSGAKLRIKGHGVGPKGEPPGDLFANILIVLPKQLDAEDWIAIKKIDSKHPLSPRDNLKW